METNRQKVIKKEDQLISMNTYLAAQGEPLEKEKAAEKDQEEKDNKKKKKRCDECTTEIPR